jgi:hypothetical protein
VRCFTGAMQCQFLAHHSLSLAFVCANQYSDRLGSQVCGAVRRTSCVHVSFALTTTAWLCIRELCTEAEVIPPIPGCPKVFLALVTSSSMLNQSIRIIRVLCNTHTHTLSLSVSVCGVSRVIDWYPVAGFYKSSVNGLLAGAHQFITKAMEALQGIAPKNNRYVVLHCAPPRNANHYC